jgi:hypothetical protein
MDVLVCIRGEEIHMRGERIRDLNPDTFLPGEGFNPTLIIAERDIEGVSIDLFARDALAGGQGNGNNGFGALGKHEPAL